MTRLENVKNNERAKMVKSAQWQNWQNGKHGRVNGKTVKPTGPEPCARCENGKTVKRAKAERRCAREIEHLPIPQYQWVDLRVYQFINQAINPATYLFTDLSIYQSTH